MSIYFFSWETKFHIFNNNFIISPHERVNGKWKMENRKSKMENGKRQIENEK
jgi:hypothetical protein